MKEEMYLVVDSYDLPDKSYYPSVEMACDGMHKRSQSLRGEFVYIIKIEKCFRINLKQIKLDEVKE